MSTIGSFNSKNPTIKRILKEASELANSPSSDYHAAPLETDLFEWHFTLRGAPAPSPFDGGIYHGRIILPPAYPLKPPSFRFLTPTGRFEVNREICLSISGHHEESWQPAWGIRTALVAIRSFMDTDAKGQLGGMDASEEVRRRFAGQSRAWRCGGCGGKSNEDIMNEQDEAVKDAGEQSKKEEEVPEELRLAYREDLDKKGTVEKVDGKANANSVSSNVAGSVTTETAPSASPTAAVPNLPQQPAQAQVSAQAQQQRQQPPVDTGVPAWIDKVIYALIAVLAVLILRKLG